MTQNRPFDAVLFDMDGVLIDAAPIHRRAFATAVKVAADRSLEEVDPTTLEGRPTKVKLEMLGITGSVAAQVFAHKQMITHAAAAAYPRDEARVDYLSAVRRAGLKTSIVTNSIGETATAFIRAAGFQGAYIIAADHPDRPRPKPAPDLYRLAARTCDVHPSRCLVFEDSPVGIEAARAAGCVVWPTTFETLPSHLDCLLRLL